MSQLFKHVIPFEILAQMPLSFVHRLRDILRKDKEDQAKQYQQMSVPTNGQNAGLQRRPQISSFPPSAIEDLLDELS
jgi:hypothetical protein